ncbi:MAG: uracil-DNA glycosylase, partial [Bacteroidia bacterium]|nr:uracil-DNA glycosylase [Bacteroidia bacterium]
TKAKNFPEDAPLHNKKKNAICLFEEVISWNGEFEYVKELKDDLGIEYPISGNLERWAKQGVFLLNAILTVRAGQAASHSKIGWNIFTDQVIKKISENKEGVVFLLWGNFAKSKKDLIDLSKHHVLEAAHPSPLARGAFFGCKHFSATNNILLSKGKDPINW